MPSITRPVASQRRVAVLAALAWVTGSCASGGDGERDAGSSRRDTGAAVDAPSMDAGAALDTATPDAGHDAGAAPDAGADATDVCGGARCMDFQRCVAGTCVDYANCRGDGTCPIPGDVCRSRRCVPGDVDVDGDGDPAATDCDEANPARSSRLAEICDTLDNNCNGAADDGDPSAMCAGSATGGVCMAGGVCACPSGSYDIDRAVSGCECTAAPGVAQGTSCVGAIDLGDIADTRGSITVTGNAIDREVWYRFRAVDTADTTCDQFNVGIHLTDGVADHEIWVVRGACDTGTTCTDATYTDYNFALDFRDDRGGMLTGQCPCWAGTPVDNVSPCEDDSTTVQVRVRRRAGAPRTCGSYTIALTNGID